MTEIGGVIEQVGAIASHAHVLQCAGQARAIHFGEKTGATPATDDASDEVPVLRVMRALLGGERHEERVIDPRWQLLRHFGLASTQHDRRQGAAYLVEVPIADHAPVVVALWVFVQ